MIDTFAGTYAVKLSVKDLAAPQEARKAECEKAGGVWVEQTKKCGAKKPQ